MILFCLFFFVLPVFLLLCGHIIAPQIVWYFSIAQFFIVWGIFSFSLRPKHDTPPDITRPSRINYDANNIIDKFYLRPNEERIKLKFHIARNKDMNTKWYYFQTQYFNRSLVVINLLASIGIIVYIYLQSFTFDNKELCTAITLLAYSIMLLLYSLYACPLYRNFIIYANSLSHFLKPLMCTFMVVLAAVYWHSINRLLLCIITALATYLFILFALDTYLSEDFSLLFFDLRDYEYNIYSHSSYYNDTKIKESDSISNNTDVCTMTDEEFVIWLNRKDL